MPVSCVLCLREGSTCRMVTMRDLKSLYLVAKLIERLVNNLHSLEIAAVSMTILIRTAAVLVSFLDMVAPKILEAGHFF
ncbi:hypothetical protein DPMN_148054 [Dreissena polymorpha]|uniref:Uncharacterized protein n=1 Tax=Dreissena polymorpha TaxID=45954 RepID=A0A9D4FD81_DREPO|nr:hypothetical protein DPMN_148054 [Dreissena polymorpha]